MHVVFLALSADRVAATADDMGYVFAHGGRVTLVAGNPEALGELDPRAVTVSLASAEQRYWLLRWERVLVYHIPDLPLRLLRRVLNASASHTPALMKHPLTRTIEAVDQLRHRVRTTANRLHQSRFLPLYRTIRPWVLWRVARHELLPRFDFSDADQIVVADVLSTPLGWHLARRLPQATVRLSFDRQLKS